MSKWSWSGAALVVFGLISAGCGAWFLGANSAAPAAAVTADDTTVVALGRIEPFGRVLTIVPATGVDQARMLTLNVHEGEQVQAGQVLATMDTAMRQKAAVEVASANLAVAQSALDRIRIEAANKIMTDSVAVERWQAERDKAAWDVQRTSHLLGSGYETKIGARQAEVALAQIEQQLKQASIALERAKANGSSGHQLDVEAAEAQVKSAQAQLAQSIAMYNETQVSVPSNGQVLKIFTRVGERVGDKGIMNFGQTAVMAVRAEVYATEIGRLRLGKEAAATSPALRAPLHGVVAEITPMVEKQSVVSADPTADTDARIVEVRIKLDEASSQAARDLTNLEVRVSIATNGASAPALASAVRP